MEIEPDFVTDEEENIAEEPSEAFFVTETAAQLPTLGRAVKVDLTNLCRRLISSTMSLMLFGASDIGVTVPGTVFELGKHAQRVLDTFPLFIWEAGRLIEAPENALSRKYDALKAAIARQGVVQGSLRNRLRLVNRRFKEVYDGEPISEFQAAANASRAAGLALNTTVAALRANHAEIQALQAENASLSKEIQAIIKNPALGLEKSRRSKKKPAGRSASKPSDVIKSAVVKLSAESVTSQMTAKANCQQLEREIAELTPLVDALRHRLNDLHRRILIDAQKVPLRQADTTTLRSWRLSLQPGLPLPRVGIPRPRYVHL
jgi:hypothetical protein